MTTSRPAPGGGTRVFTVCLEDRGSDLPVREIGVSPQTWVRTARARPFRTEAAVVLPDHLHCIRTLPPGDTDFGVRWGAIKARFTRGVRGRMGFHPIERPSQRRKGDAGIWQRRFRGEARPETGPADRFQRRTGEAPAAKPT